jgi:RNA polymerase sigma factor (TIGR02999 family)
MGMVEHPCRAKTGGLTGLGRAPTAVLALPAGPVENAEMAGSMKPPDNSSDITALLAAARAGDEAAAGAAFSALYQDLRRLARSRLRQHQTLTLLDTTSLVHESYLKLLGVGAAVAEDRRHFFAYAAHVMRSVIVDFARARQAERRGGAAEHVALDTGVSADLVAPETDVLRVHEALEAVSQADPRAAQVVEMRYFGGLSEAEIADARPRRRASRPGAPAADGRIGVGRLERQRLGWVALESVNSARALAMDSAWDLAATPCTS